jgi:hypothetical protein
MLYMFLLYSDPNVPPPDDLMERHFAVAAAARKRNGYIASEAIGQSDSATTVRVRDGKAVVTDGPFAETKEVLGGFYLLDCKDLDEALDYAKRIPDAMNGAVEVRPVFFVPEWEYAAGAERERRPFGS